MPQAVFTPGQGGIPHGTILIAPQFPGEASVAAPTLELQKHDRVYDEALQMIAGRLGKLAQEQVTAKAPVEERAIRAVRAFHGQYEPGKNFSDSQSTAFVRATRSKTVALEARLFDLIFPTDDRNWGTSPTPVPKLATEVSEAETYAKSAADAANAAEAEGDAAGAQQIVAAGQDQANRAKGALTEIERATKAAKLMQEEIDDQLVESQYPSESRLMISDACRLGTGILKGPIVNEQRRGRWIPKEGAAAHQFELHQSDDPRPLVRRVDFWSFFPDMSARTIEEAEFTFERYLWTASDLRKMVKSHGFDPAAVRELLRDDGPNRKANTDASLTKLVQLRSITGGKENNSGAIKGRYIGWEYHGPLQCDEIAAILRWLGREDEALAYEEDDDPLREIRVIIHFCGNVILKIADAYPLDSGDTLYSVFCVEKDEANIFGYGIPTIMADSQDALNSGWRMVLDNGAMSVGPMTVIDKEAIEPQNGSWVLRAKKMFFRTKAAVPHTPDPIQFVNVPNNVQYLAQIIGLAEQFIDMESGIPQPQQGEQGAHTTQTVGGMAILQNAANIVFRRTVKNYDDGIISPTMRRFFDWNMQFSPKAEIKGDMQVDARGTSVLLLKEVQATNLMIVVTQLMANPEIAPMIKAYPAIEKLFQAMMIKPDDVMVGEDKYDQLMADRAAQPPPPSPQEIQAQARVEAAEIMAEVKRGGDQVALQLAEIKRQTEMIKLAEAGDITLAELEAMLQAKKMETDSSERRLLTEAAIEKKNADDARARGESPTGSGGLFSAGDGKDKAA